MKNIMSTIKKEDIDYKKLQQDIQEFSCGRVLIIGDLMIDTYLIGDSTRISPEAPVPVVKIEETKHVLGGAGNVARSVIALGGQATIFGLVGKDNAANDMQAMFEKNGIKAHLFALSHRTTTIKTRVLARGQQMLRMDTETNTPLEKEESKNFCALLESELKEHDIVVVSDYAKGLITQELMDFLRAFINSKGNKLKILADPKPENKEVYKELFLLTPNLKETAELAQRKNLSIQEIEEVGKELKEDLKLNHILTTLGSHGMALFTEQGSVWHIPTTAQQVFDVTGAGDTVIATLALALSVDIPLLEACILANYAAGIVVGKIGSATANQEEIKTVLSQKANITH